MRSLMSMFVVAGLFGGVPLMTGCEKEVMHEKKVSETSGGGTKVEEKTIKENPDGTMTKETETKRMNP